MEDLYTERRVAVRRAPALPLQNGARCVPVALALLLSACSHTTPSIGGSAAVSPAPGTPYKAPRGVVPPEPDSGTANKTLPPDLAEHGTASRSPTRWTSRSATIRRPRSRGRRRAPPRTSTDPRRARIFPEIDATANLSRSQSVTQTGFVERTQFAPLVSLSYLLLDFGGRSGTIGAARENTIARESRLQRDAADGGAASRERLLRVHLGARARARAAQDGGGGDSELPGRGRAPSRRRGDHRRRAAGADGARAGASSISRPTREPSRRATATSRRRWGCARTRSSSSRCHRTRCPVGSASDSVDTLVVSALANRPDMAGRAREHPPGAAGGARRALGGISGAHRRRERRAQLLEPRALRREQLRAHARPHDPDLQRLRAPVRSRRREVARGRAARRAPGCCARRCRIRS